MNVNPKILNVIAESGQQIGYTHHVSFLNQG